METRRQKNFRLKHLKSVSRISIVLLVFILGFKNANAQCFIKSTDQSSGFITYYVDPELVAQTDEFGAAFSVQMVANKYYLAITYQFRNRAQPVEEKVALELNSGYIIELDMYTMQVGGGAGVELCMAVFYMEDDQMKYLKASPIKEIVFRTKDGVKHELPASKNQDVLVRQLKCFKK